MAKAIRVRLFQACLLLLTWLGAATIAPAQTLTAEAFARDPNVIEATLSPNGRYVAVIRWDADGQALIIYDWRANHAVALERARTDRFLFIDWVAWKTDDRLLFALHQRAYWRGTPGLPEATRIYAVDRDGTNLQQMFEGQFRRLASDTAPPQLVDIAHNDPNHVLMSTWGAYGFSLFRLDVNTGDAEMVERMEWRTGLAAVDGDGHLVMRADALPNNSGIRYYRRAPQGGAWVLAHEVRRASVAQNRDFALLGPGPAAGQVYVAARPEGQEFQAIYLYNTATGELGAPVFYDDHADAEIASINRNDNSLLFGCGELQRWRCRALDPRMQRHVTAISAYFENLADFSVTDVSSDGKIWLIYANGATIPGTYYIYDLDTAHISPIASDYPDIPRAQLMATRTFDYASHDGTALWGYLTVPGGAGPHPLVVLPHGGPESRDAFGYNPLVQYLASRGYVVFQPNFRGSEGSGHTFVAAGHEQWGLRMQDDISDGVRALTASGVADANRVCIVGGSYGGYAALAGAAFTPTLYKCAESISGVSDLLEFISTERQESGGGSLGYAYWATLVGDPGPDRERLVATSPARQVAAVQIPILLIHGSDDPTVPIHQSEIMRDALQHAGKRVQYIRLEHEGHAWAAWTPADRQRLMEETARFLDANIGTAAH
jgi:dipeptidyl aminopeptidase/acylaminoacyl peptidase